MDEGGLATIVAGVHLGNGSRIQIIEAAAAAATLPPLLGCSLAFGNLSGNGTLSVGSRPLQLDAVTLHPSFRSPSPFTPNVAVPPEVLEAQAEWSRAPAIVVEGDVKMTQRTITLLDVFGSVLQSLLDFRFGLLLCTCI